MRELFDRLLAEGEAGIDRLVAERTQESVTLDFKKKVDASNGRPEDQDKRVLAKAMSAFANSAGGLIVYGVHGVPGLDGVDCAQDARPIAEIDRFVSALHELTGELLQPRHSGIQVGMIRSERTAGTGFAVVNVERSERRPHRSEAKDQKQYFKRGGSKSYAMEHYDIEDAFRRVSTPDLMLSLGKAGIVQNGSIKLLYLALQLTNSSNTTARFPYIHIADLVNCAVNRIIAAKFEFDTDRGRFMFSGNADRVINPGVTLVAGHVNVQVEGNESYDPPSIGNNDEISFSWQFGCENVQAKRNRFSFRLGDVPDGNLVIAM